MAPQQVPYKRFRRRIRRSFCYTKDGRMDQLSLPLSELAADYFEDHSPFDYLDMDFATRLSREACVSPCSLIVALLYLDRLRNQAKDQFESSDPADLYLAALMVASKYLNDDGECEFVYNDEWAASAEKSKKEVNRLELELLKALDWRLGVDRLEFGCRLSEMETAVCQKEVFLRGFCSYADLRVLLTHSSLSLLQPLIAAIGVAWLVYAASVVGLYAFALHLATPLGVPGRLSPLHVRPTTHPCPSAGSCPDAVSIPKKTPEKSLSCLPDPEILNRSQETAIGFSKILHPAVGILVL